jgi:NAD(P)-dependent dehydrogenase (short-subunit alcohol dehydrogenase family)
MQDKPVALVTGANKGIGLQIAKDLAAHGFIVLVGSRDLGRGEAAAKSVGADARAVQLDVTDQASLDEVRAVFETNVFGVIAVTQAMLPLRSEQLRGHPHGRAGRARAGATCAPRTRRRDRDVLGRGWSAAVVIR